MIFYLLSKINTDWATARSIGIVLYIAVYYILTQNTSSMIPSWAVLPVMILDLILVQYRNTTAPHKTERQHKSHPQPQRTQLADSLVQRNSSPPNVIYKTEPMRHQQQPNRDDEKSLDTITESSVETEIQIDEDTRSSNSDLEGTARKKSTKSAPKSTKSAPPVKSVTEKHSRKDHSDKVDIDNTSDIEIETN